MPQRLAGKNHSAAKALELRDCIRVSMNLVGAAHGSDLEVIAVACRDGHAITTDEHAAIVGNSISDLLHVEAFVNRAIERVELRLAFQSLAEPPLLLAG